MHTTLSITQLYESLIRANKTRNCQETTQPIGLPSYTTMEMYVLITMTHHFSNIFLVGLWREPCFVRFTKYSPFDFTALCSDAFAVSVWQLYLKIVIQTHYITFQDINLQPYFEIACVKSVLWPVLNSNVVDVSLPSGSLGYWTACNNFKRHGTLPLLWWLYKLKSEKTLVEGKHFITTYPMNILLAAKLWFQDNHVCQQLMSDRNWSTSV